jgi:chromosome segregation ATPase
MTDKPTADKARLLIDALRIAARASRRPEKTTAWQAADALQSALARAEAAEARIAVLCEEIDMKEGVLSALRTRAEAAEKERDELLLKHCTALERESFENLIKHEKWQEREAVYKSQIEAGAKRIEAAEKALEPFARIAPAVEVTDKRDGNCVHRQFFDGRYYELTKDDFRRAARALSAAGGQ